MIFAGPKAFKALVKNASIYLFKKGQMKLSVTNEIKSKYTVY
ncbi:MAG: hypothetical protein CM1200mP40_23460 [Gammaproteobacteria bacterium]|nr:MAG: hypothetical protein CM1200mP40_23460 [Gammaproteobacteria bacterium]